ncbi:MAG: M48 family metallopeptidase [Saprospiraceae bacterium]|nr:M48 family metallopeptidase [Saprospiraceae bacterium]MBX7178651.1 M48 family metallopeptidase [Saprospiraceae bacterium]MCB0590360.1 M48 family metallopeptidase [Saprospiraceae bacterium]
MRIYTLRNDVSHRGSCISQNNIILSNRLLLAPLETPDQVIIHELAHTVHTDHSFKFRRLVLQHDPDMRHHHPGSKQYGNTLVF